MPGFVKIGKLIPALLRAAIINVSTCGVGKAISAYGRMYLEQDAVSGFYMSMGAYCTT